MKLRTVLLAALLCLPSCAVFQPFGQSVKADPAVCAALPAETKAACSAAGDVLVKGYAALTGINQTIKDNVASGAYSKAYAQSLLDKSIDARKRLDQAYVVFQRGDYKTALSQANIVQTLLTALTAELAKRAEQEQK